MENIHPVLLLSFSRRTFHHYNRSAALISYAVRRTFKTLQVSQLPWSPNKQIKRHYFCFFKCKYEVQNQVYCQVKLSQYEKSVLVYWCIRIIIKIKFQNINMKEWKKYDINKNTCIIPTMKIPNSLFRILQSFAAAWCKYTCLVLWLLSIYYENCRLPCVTSSLLTMNILDILRVKTAERLPCKIWLINIFMSL